MVLGSTIVLSFTFYSIGRWGLQLVLVVGDLHIPSRATSISEKFRRILVSL